MRWLQQVREKVFGARAREYQELPNPIPGEGLSVQERNAWVLQQIHDTRQQEMFTPNQLPLGRVLEETRPFDQARERMTARTMPWERERSVGWDGYER